MNIYIKSHNMEVIPKGFVRFYWEEKKWKMVLQLWCAWNTNSFAILQKNQDKRPLRATPTPFHLSLKTLSGRLKRICHLAKHVKQVWQRFITKGIWKTRLIFILIFIHIQYADAHASSHRRILFQIGEYCLCLCRCLCVCLCLSLAYDGHTHDHPWILWIVQPI